LKPNDAWGYVFFTSLIGIPVVIFLKRYQKKFPFYILTPNAITFFSFSVFLVAVVLLFMSPSQHRIICWFIFMAMILDDIDGTYARATAKASRFGAILDSFLDVIRIGIGLPLIGLALGREYSNYILPVVLFIYSIYHVAYHMNLVTKFIEDNVSCENEDTENMALKTPWHRFCDERGLNYYIYSEYDAYLMMVLALIIFPDPSWPVIFIVFSRFLYWPLVSVFAPKGLYKRLSEK
jgi:phosphatidylglycerophosphate synthase